MFDYMLEVNGLTHDFYERGLSDADIMFIKEQIADPMHAAPPPVAPAAALSFPSASSSAAADSDADMLSPPRSQPFCHNVTPGTADMHWP